MQQVHLAIVARAVNYKDHDRILTLITREAGRMTVSAHGCRKPQSKLLSATQPFCYGEYALTQRMGKLYVTSCDVREIFYPIRIREGALTAASYAMAVALDYANEGEEYKRQFSLLLYTLSSICDEKYDLKTVLAFYLAKMMDFVGYCPQTDCCIHCGSTQNLDYFDLQEGGATCRECDTLKNGLRKISKQTLDVLGWIPQVPSAALEKAQKIVEPQSAELFKLLTEYVQLRTETKLPSLKTL